MIPQLTAGLVFAVSLSVAGLGLYMQGRKDGRAACVAADAREREIAQLAADTAAGVAATAISRIEVRNVTVNKALEREVLTREVFRDCRSGADAVRLLNSTPGIATAGPEPAGGSELPASGAAR